MLIIMPWSNILARQNDIELSASNPEHYSIVCSAEATEAEKNAASELSEHLKKAIGINLPILKEEDSIKGPAIYVGQTKFALSNKIFFNDFGREEWLIKAIGKNIVIGGGRPRGTLYGAWEFLERYAGIMWLDENYTYFPNSNQLILSEDLVERGTPAFAIRGVYTFKDNPDSRRTFMARNRQNLFHDESIDSKKMGLSPIIGSPRACHTFYYYTKDWPTEYEKYFSLDAYGKRLRAKGPAGPGQVCLSNPQVRELFVNRLRKFINADRKSFPTNYPVIYDVSANDNADKCVCPDCLSLEKKYGAYSGVMLDFINVLADNIAKDYPDVKIQTFAYMFTEKPPRGIVAHPNVLVRIAQLGSEFSDGTRDTMRPLTHLNNKALLDQFRRWKPLSKLAVWDYGILYGFTDELNDATVNVAAISANLKLYKESSVESVFIESEDPDTTCFYALRLWLEYQLMQKPDQDINSLTNRFMNAYYGAAGPFMRQLLEYIEKRMTEIKGRINDIPVAKRTYLDNDFFIVTEQLLDNAENAVKNDANALRRISKERVPLDSARLKRDKYLSNDLLPKSNVIASRLQKNWQDVICDYYPSSIKATRLKKISDKIERLSTNIKLPLPSELKEHKVIDLIWTNFDPLTTLGVKIVDDPDAAGGKAMCLSVKDDKKPSDLEMGIYSASSKRKLIMKHIPMGEIPQDEKFHLYSLGSVTLEPKCLVWAHKSWRIQHRLWDIYEEKELNNYEIYLSLKIQGASYVSGSQKPDSILMDRVLLVRPNKSKP